MTPRKRSTKNRDLPENLYEARGYYKYRHPVTGQYHKMGTDRARAIAAANKLNVRLVKPIDLVRGVLQAEAGSIADLVRRYKAERQALEDMKPSTRKLEDYRLNAIVKGLGHLPTLELSVRTCAEWLDGFNGNAYTKHRGSLIKVCRFGVAKGLLETNPAEGTLTNPSSVEKKKRKPMKKEWFDMIHAAAPEWMQVAMDFALITLQRRGDCVTARYTDIEGDVLKVIQAKTEKHGYRAFLRIEIGEGLADVIARSRQIKPVCPYILHRMPLRKHKNDLDHWAMITPDHLSKTFAQVRDGLPVFQGMPKEERPTFHEIRGLGGKLYLDAGYSDDYVNKLMGHTSQKMTDSYTDQHQEWTECRADLKAQADDH